MRNAECGMRNGAVGVGLRLDYVFPTSPFRPPTSNLKSHLRVNAKVAVKGFVQLIRGSATLRRPTLRPAWQVAFEQRANVA